MLGRKGYSGCKRQVFFSPFRKLISSLSNEEKKNGNDIIENTVGKLLFADSVCFIYPMYLQQMATVSMKNRYTLYISNEDFYFYLYSVFCVCLNSFFINLQRFNHDFLSTVSCMKDLKHTKSANGFQLNEYSISFFLPLFTLF